MEDTNKELKMLICIVKTIRLMKSAGLKAKTEGLVIASRDRSLSKGIYQANIQTVQTQYVDRANK